MVLFFWGCAHIEPDLSPKRVDDILNSTPISVDLTLSSSELSSQLKSVRALIEKGQFDAVAIDKIDQLYYLYQVAQRISKKGSIRLPPFSRVKVKFPSFCLDPSKAAPSENEQFRWTTEKVAIPYYDKLIRITPSEYGANWEDLQELIWSLGNGSKYEDYPLHLAGILDRLDPNAKFNLPSRAKDSISGEVGAIISEKVSEVEAIESLVSLVEGKYYSYSEFAAFIQKKAKTTNSTALRLTTLADEPGVSTSVQSSSYSDQVVVFYNSTGNAANIDVSDYHLAPIDSSIQRIGLSIDVSLGNKIVSVIEAALKESIIRNSAYWYAGRLTPLEIEFIKGHPVDALNAYAQSHKAIASTWKYFGRNADRDESDAFRHFLWAGLLFQHLDESLTTDYLAAHEQILPSASAVDRASSEMDRYNNAAGLQVAKELAKRNELSLKNLEKSAYEALQLDRLRVINPKGKTSSYMGQP